MLFRFKVKRHFKYVYLKCCHCHFKITFQACAEFPLLASYRVNQNPKFVVFLKLDLRLFCKKSKNKDLELTSR